MSYDPEYQKNWYKNNKEKHLANVRRVAADRKKVLRERLQSLKEVSPCLDCGVKYPYYVMQYDHVRGEKVLELSKAVNSGWSDIKLNAELEKCDLVCANCHAIRTHERRQGE